ncbi:MAG: TolC family outer membrane protein [Rhodobacterales bacterium]|nr:TolC family outer membrane protein [Rhodobacterales bacterium]NCT12969.1 TolC family outer membrane protein [Rhodobacterales bacterium]
MRMRRIIGGAIMGLTLLAAPFASTARAETLAQALAHGYENSGLLDQNRALLRAADEDVAQAVSALLPIVNWSAGLSTVSPRFPGADLITGNLQFSAELTIYDFGRTQYAIDVQKELVLATREQLVGVEQRVLLRIVEAYMEVRRAQEFVALRQNNVRLITQELRAAQDRFEVGEVTRTDVALAEARLASARSQLAAQEGALVRAAEEYRAAVGRAPSGLQSVPPAPVSRSVAEAKALALRTHPSLREAQHSVTAAEINILRAEAAMRPTVSLQGSVSLDLNGNDTERLGLNVGGPIYQGGRLSSQVRQFMARRDAARAGLLIAARDIEQNVGNAYSFLEVARASREASERQVRAARVAFEGVREEATLGSRTTLDVLNAEQEQLDAAANLISAQVDETLASYSVLSAMGLLTAQHLGLNVQIYDPAAYYNLVDDAPTAMSQQGEALDRVLRAIGN